MTQEASQLHDVSRRDESTDDVRTERRRVPVPRLLLLSVPLNVLALAGGCWMFINAFVLLDQAAPAAVVLLSLVNIIVLLLVAKRIVDMRAVEEQRRFSRVALVLAGAVNGNECRITELSLSGCQIEVPHSAQVNVGQNVDVSFTLSGSSFDLAGVVHGLGASRRGGVLLRIGFHPGQNGYIERLAMGLLADNDKAWAA